MFAEVLGQCAAQMHLDLSYNQIGDAGAVSLARSAGAVRRAGWCGSTCDQA